MIHNIVNKSENEDNLHKLAAKSTLPMVQVCQNCLEVNIADIWLRSHISCISHHFLNITNIRKPYDTISPSFISRYTVYSYSIYCTPLYIIEIIDVGQGSAVN